MGGGFIGRAGDTEFPVGFLMGIIIGIPFIIINGFARLGVGGKSFPVFSLIGEFFQHKKTADKGDKDTGKGKQVFPLSAALKKGSGRRSSGIQIFSNADHADHRKEHQKSLPPETKTVSGEQ